MTNSSDTRRRLRETSIPLVIVVLAIGLRAYGLRWGLPGIYEEATPLQKAWEMWGWGTEKGLDLNPHFFNYPSLTLYLHFAVQGLLFLAMKVQGVVTSTLDYQVAYILDKTIFYVVGRWLSTLFGVGAVALLYALGKRAGGFAAAIPAALMLAVNTQHISRSQMIEVDVPLTFFTILTLWCVFRAMDHPSLRNYILVGLALGLAASTKYTGALLGLPILVAFFLTYRKHRTGANHPRKKPKTVGTRPRWTYVVLAFAIASITFMVTSPYVLLDFGTFEKHFSLERNHMRLGHFGAEDTPTWRYYMELLTGSLLGWPIVLLAIAGLIFLTVVWKQPWALVVGSFLVPYLIIISTWEMQASRYLLPVLPLFMLFAGGIITMGLRTTRIAGRSSLVRGVAVTTVIAVMAVPTIQAFPQHVARTRPDPRTEAGQWIQSNVPNTALIVSEAYGPDLFGVASAKQLDKAVRKEVLEKKTGNLYAVVKIPMFQVGPWRTKVYYSLSLYRDADYIVTTNAVRSRYTRDPQQFAEQVAFYDSLETTFEKVVEFEPKNRTSKVTIYKNPVPTLPFGKRKTVYGTGQLRRPENGQSAAEENFYLANAINYEVFSFTEEALASYRQGLNYPVKSPYVLKELVLGGARSALKLGRPQEALSLVDLAIASSLAPSLRPSFEELKRQIESRLE